MSRLTFENGKFVFTVQNFVLRELSGMNYSGWQFESASKGVGRYVTTDFKVAAPFSFYADHKARRIFDRVLVKHYSPPKARLPAFLDPHQREGVTWILTRSRSYLAHAPGAGKTAQAIVAALLAKGPGQALFIVPPSLTANWAREIAKVYDLTPSLNKEWAAFSVIPESKGQEYAGWNANFVIVPDSMLTKDWVLNRLLAMNKKLVAVDEASRFKDPSAQRTIVLFGGTLKDGRAVPGLVQDARHAVLLDGSPMPNRPMELWAPTYAMAPETIDFMGEQDFGFRYCGATCNNYGQWEFKHSSREDELKQKLQKNFMHVVKEEALSHPGRLRSILFMSEDARSPAHKEWERRHLKNIKLSDISDDMNRGDIAHYRAELGMRKVSWGAKYVKMRIDEKNESILLFAWHREVVEALGAALQEFKPALVYGGVKAKDREKAFADFQAGRKKLLILNIAAGGRGHNLQRADRAVFLEFSWTDELNKQCEKRASRRGNDKLFTRCDYIVSPNSVDEVVLTGVFKKAERVRKVIG